MASVEPAAGWQLWQDKDWLYPSSTLPALEAIQAAKEQGLDASERLDMGCAGPSGRSRGASPTSG